MTIHVNIDMHYTFSANGQEYDLRLVRTKDALAIASAVCSNSEHFRYMVDWPQPYAKSSAQEFVRKALKDARTGSGYHYVIRHNACLSGMCAIYDINERHRRASLGFWVSPHSCRRGIASAAVQLLLSIAYGRLKLVKICATTVAGNDHSASVLRRNGFVCEGTQRQHVVLNGCRADEVLWAHIRSLEATKLHRELPAASRQRE